MRVAELFRGIARELAPLAFRSPGLFSPPFVSCCVFVRVCLRAFVCKRSPFFSSTVLMSLLSVAWLYLLSYCAGIVFLKGGLI